MTVPEIWRGQGRGGKKKKKKNERGENHIASPTRIANYMADLQYWCKKEPSDRTEILTFTWQQPILHSSPDT